MRIFALAFKDLKQLFQNKMTAFFLLIMPVLFTVMFGFIFGGFSSGEQADSRLALAVVDQDHSNYSQGFIELLGESQTIRLADTEGSSVEELRSQVEDGDLAGLAVIPVGFGAALQTGEQPVVNLTENPDAAADNAVVEGELRTDYNRLYGAALAAALSQQVYNQGQDFASGVAAAQYSDAGLALALQAWRKPPVTVSNTQAVTASDEEIDAYGGNAFSQSSPAMMAQFAIAGLIGAAELLVSERKKRTMTRMLTTRISRMEILLGHYIAIVIMVFLQLVTLAGFGQIFLKLPYFQRPLATLALLTATALMTGAVGLLVGALAKNSDQAAVYAMAPMFVFSGLGGAWVPLEFASRGVQSLSKFIPISWTIQSLKEVLQRGAGIVDVWPAALALLGFTVVFFGLAVWRFRFEGE